MIDKRRTKNFTAPEQKTTVVKVKKPPKQMEVYERQEVYSISFNKKKPKIQRKHINVSQTDHAVQPLVARPRLEATLKAVIDPNNKHLLDPNAKTMTLGRTGTLPRGGTISRSMTLGRPPKARSATMQRPVSVVPTVAVSQKSMPQRPPSLPSASPLTSRRPLENGSQECQVVETLLEKSIRHKTEKTTNGVMGRSFNTSNLNEVEIPFHTRKSPTEGMNGQENQSELLNKMALFMGIEKFDDDIYDTTDGVLNKENALKSFEAYISTNSKLKSADLQGEYSAFNWRMGDINPHHWETIGKVGGWPDLVLIRDNSLTIDYVKLPKIDLKPGCLLYPEYSIDILLQNWLDRKSTIPRSGALSRNQKNCPELLHTVTLLSSLNDLQTALYTSKETHTCLLLSILLSLQYCLETMNDCKLQLQLEDILLVSTPTNCLVVFRTDEHVRSSPAYSTYSSDSTAPEMIELINVISPIMKMFKVNPSDTLHDSIDIVIGTIARQVANLLQHDQTFSAKLLKALAPPDWTALTLSQIAVSKL